MFIFIDVVPLLKEIKNLQATCRKCGKNDSVKLVKSYQCLRLFFLPVWKWDLHYYLIHENCGMQVEISEEDAILIQYKDKNPATCQAITVVSTQRSCANCGKILEKGYTYCPYCGQENKNI